MQPLFRHDHPQQTGQPREGPQDPEEMGEELDDEARDGQAMEVGGRLISSDRAKAEAFAREYARVSRQVRVPRLERIARHKMAHPTMRACKECEGRRCGACSLFEMDDLVKEISRLQLKKSPGPDQLYNEMLRHLGPVARAVLLSIIKESWTTGQVPRQWRATVVPIPKSAKDKKLVSSYRPIALTSHVGKLAERLIKSRLVYLTEYRGMIPSEQVGFRAGRSVGDSIGRLVQEVHDGWQRPKSRKRNSPEGTTAQKFVLVAFDFARAYDVVDHRLLRVRLLELGLPLCLVQWMWQWLRNGSVRVEVSGVKSRERMFLASLPQGSVLARPCFCYGRHRSSAHSKISRDAVVVVVVVVSPRAGLRPAVSRRLSVPKVAAGQGRHGPAVSQLPRLWVYGPE